MDRGNVKKKRRKKKKREKKKEKEERRELWDEDGYELSKKKLRIEKIKKKRSGGMGRAGKNNKQSALSGTKKDLRREKKRNNGIKNVRVKKGAREKLKS